MVDAEVTAGAVGPDVSSEVVGRLRRTTVRRAPPMLHEAPWTLERLPDGRYLVRDRDGRGSGLVPRRPGHSRPPPQRPV